MVAITPNLKFTVADDDGSPLAGGKVFFYTAGTSTKQNTYTDSTGATPNANPVVLDARGDDLVKRGRGQPNRCLAYLVAG